jgi:Fe2+ transport system protein FeoA
MCTTAQAEHIQAWHQRKWRKERELVWTNLIRIGYTCHPARRTSYLHFKTPLAYTDPMMRRLNPFRHWLRHEGHRPTADGELTLADLQVHEHAQVLDLRCGKVAMNRLISLGFTPGAEVGMTQNYGRGPLIVTVRGGSVALGRGEARHIRVERSGS